MKISAVTVSYNSAATIGGTIESFLRQDYPDKELVVIDGASSDDTLKIVESFGSSAIRVFSEPDRGAYDAMNKGLLRFAGDAMGFLNSDDTYHDDHVLTRIARGLENADMVYGDIHMVADHDSKRLIRSWKAGKYGRWSYHLGWMPPHPTFYARRHVIEAVGEFDLTYPIAADYDFMLRAMVKNDFRAAYVTHVLVDFQLGGISTKNWKATVQGNLECLHSRRTHLRSPTIDAALFLRPLRRIVQLKQITPYLFR